MINELGTIDQMHKVQMLGSYKKAQIL